MSHTPSWHKEIRALSRERTVREGRAGRSRRDVMVDDGLDIAGWAPWAIQIAVDFEAPAGERSNFLTRPKPRFDPLKNLWEPSYYPPPVKD